MIYVGIFFQGSILTIDTSLVSFGSSGNKNNFPNRNNHQIASAEGIWQTYNNIMIKKYQFFAKVLQP